MGLKYTEYAGPQGTKKTFLQADQNRGFRYGDQSYAKLNSDAEANAINLATGKRESIPHTAEVFQFAATTPPAAAFPTLGNQLDGQVLKLNDGLYVKTDGGQGEVLRVNEDGSYTLETQDPNALVFIAAGNEVDAGFEV